jgi:hypothetical protein
MNDTINTSNFWRVQKMVKVQALSVEEQKALTLCIVDEALKLAQEKGVTFEEELNQDIFVNSADISLAEMICKNIDTLHEENYISGDVEIAHEIELDENFNEIESDNIDFAECTFENIELTIKGNTYLNVEVIKKVGKDFCEKSKPLVKLIATTALQSAVDVAVRKAMGVA